MVIRMRYLIACPVDIEVTTSCWPVGSRRAFAVGFRVFCRTLCFARGCWGGFLGVVGTLGGGGPVGWQVGFSCCSSGVWQPGGVFRWRFCGCGGPAGRCGGAGVALCGQRLREVLMGACPRYGLGPRRVVFRRVVGLAHVAGVAWGRSFGRADALSPSPAGWSSEAMVAPRRPLPARAFTRWWGGGWGGWGG